MADVIEVNCETDFVARTDDFQELVRDVAMHIAAADPQFLRREDVTAAVLEKEKDIQKARAINEGKPEKVAEKIVERPAFDEQRPLSTGHRLRSVVAVLRAPGVIGQVLDRQPMRRIRG